VTQRELNRALARTTGESVRAISRFGFSLVDPDVPDGDLDVSDIGPRMVDWDRLEADRRELAIQA